MVKILQKPINEEKYVNNLLDFMANNKLKSDFYERIADFYIFNNENGSYRMSSNMSSALTTMKARDRALRENSNIIKTLTDELSGEDSIGPYLMIKGVANNMESKK